MGSEKSTTTLHLADRLQASGVPARGITEGVAPHPIRFDWDQPWNEVQPEEIAAGAIAKWRAYVESAQSESIISIVDGQIFHGNLTSLFLLEADEGMMRAFCDDICAALGPLDPLLIYFRQDDVDRAVRRIGAERGDQWVRYQVEWKLAAPYAARQNLRGLQGLVDLYRDYRALTDRLFASLVVPKLSIETSRHDWDAYDDLVDAALMDRRRAGS
jgi:hypothetical protein